MSGGVFSSFIFPSFGSYVLANYEIDTCFLIFAFIIFLATFGVVVQRAPRYECSSITIDDKFVTVEKLNKPSIQSDQLIKCFKCSLVNDDKCDICKHKLTSSIGSNQQQNGTTNDSRLSLENVESSFENTATSQNEDKKKKTTTISRQEGSVISNLIFISKKPMFYIITVTFVLYNICLQVFLMTIVDMTKSFQSESASKDDVGIKLIFLFSLADLIGRLGSGWFLDKNYISLKNVTILCELTLLTTFIVLPNLDSLLTIQLATFVIGLMIGIITILWPLLNVSEFGTDKLAIILGLNCFFSGLESLFRPYLIGLYLDHLNSYSYLYYNIAGFAGFVALLWLLSPLLNKSKK